MLVRVLLSILVLASALPAAAAVESVTVFPDRATVTRIVATGISAGSGELVQSDLPTGIARDSLRISASGPAGLRLGAYRLETLRGSERVSQRARELESRLQQLRDERAAIEDAVEARNLQIELVRSLATGAGQGDEKLAVEGWRSAIETVGTGAEDVLAERRRLNLDKRELDEQIERLERELADLGQQQRDTLELRLAWTSETSGPARFTIEYTVSGAAWRPVYEWRLDTGEGRLEIVQFAEVRQRTGEDWTDAELNLSLARPSSGGRLPEPSPWWIDVLRPEKQAPAGRAEVSALRAPTSMMDQAGAPAAEAQWDGAELVGSDYTQAYRVAGRSSVAADNQAHRFRLDTHRLPVSLSARTLPRRQPTAWLYAEGLFEGDSALPPGAATLYQDHTLVGQLRFAGIAPGDTLASSFGVDDRIRIERELLADERATEGMLRKSTRLRRIHRITLHNGHSRPIDVTVLDSMPVARDERIEVSLTENTTPPDERNVDDKPGVLAWQRRLDAGAEARLTVGYTLSFPEDLPGIQGW